LDIRWTLTCGYGFGRTGRTCRTDLRIWRSMTVMRLTRRRAAPEPDIPPHQVLLVAIHHHSPGV